MKIEVKLPTEKTAISCEFAQANLPVASTICLVSVSTLTPQSPALETWRTWRRERARKKTTESIFELNGIGEGLLAGGLVPRPIICLRTRPGRSLTLYHL